MKVLVILLIVLLSPCASSTQVVLVLAGQKEEHFWELVDEVSSAAAQSLDVQLEVIYGGEDRFSTLGIIEKVVERPTKPDYIIFRPNYGNATHVFNLIEKHSIPFVTLESASLGKEALAIQEPKQKYQFWIGEVLFNNVEGGKLLLEALLDEHYLRHPNVNPSIVGLGGNFDELSTTRQQALAALNGTGPLNQIFPTYWKTENIATNFKSMLERYPYTNIFWCAGDKLAMEAQKQYKRMFNKPAVVGGFDWIPDALIKIQQGELTASVGGHFLMGAIAIVKVLDHQHGIDRFLVNSEPNSYELVTKGNVDSYLSFIQKNAWQEVNFNQFSAFKSGRTPATLTMRNLLQSTQQAKLDQE